MGFKKNDKCVPSEIYSKKEVLTPVKKMEF